MRRSLLNSFLAVPASRLIPDQGDPSCHQSLQARPDRLVSAKIEFSDSGCCTWRRADTLAVRSGNQWPEITKCQTEPSEFHIRVDLIIDF